MSVTKFAVNSDFAVKTWSKQLASEVSKATAIASLIGTDTNSIIQLKEETAKTAGDKITFGLRKHLVGAGVSEGAKLEGQEEALSVYSDAVMLNELAHAVRVQNEGTIDAQRVAFNLREEANAGLADWYSERLSISAFIHLCGYNAAKLDYEGTSFDLSQTLYTGFNKPSAPSAGRLICAGDKATEAELVEKDKFDLSLIDKAVECAKLASPKIRPIKIDGENLYVMYLHPTQVTALRTNTNTGQWLDIQKSAYNGSRSKNPIFNGSLGMYNGVILREADHVMPGIAANGTALPKVRRAVLLGAQAGVIAFGKNRGGERYSLREELFDYGRELGVAVKTIFGFKKTVFNTQDFATIVVSSYAAPTWKTTPKTAAKNPK